MAGLRRGPMSLAMLAALHAGAFQATRGDLQLPPTPWPLNVYVQITMIEVAKIDAVEQAVYADFYFTMFWRDDSVNASLVFDQSVQFWPEIEFTNRLQREAINVEWTFVPGQFYGLPSRFFPPNATQGTWISAYSRISGTFVTRLQMQDFPMDLQNATIKIESPLLDETQVIYRPVADLAHFMVSEHMEVVGWRILSSDAVTMRNYYPSFDQTYSQLRVFVELGRQSSYYLDRLVANVALLVFMAFFASVLRPDVPERTIAVLTSFMAIVTWMFIIIEDSPRAGYTTRLDNFMNMSFGISVRWHSRRTTTWTSARAAFHVQFAMSVAHAINYALWDMQEGKWKKQKRESMMKLHKTLEKLAARGDPGAQAMLSARLQNPHGYRAARQSLSPKGAYAAPFFPPATDGAPTPSRARGASPGWGQRRTMHSMHSASPDDAPNVQDKVVDVQANVVVRHASRDASPPTVDTRAPGARALALLHSGTGDAAVPTTRADDGQGATVAIPLSGDPASASPSMNGQLEPNPLGQDASFAVVEPSQSRCAACFSPFLDFFGMLARAWQKASTTRKIDVLITIVCAIAYIVGILVIFLTPPTRPVSIESLPPVAH